MEEKGKSYTCDTCVYKSYLFDELTKEERLQINLNRVEREFNRGETICHEGEEIKDFIYLKEGLVKLYKEAKGRHEHIISIAQPMDFIGLLSVFSNARYIYSIKAVERSSLCFIKLETIRSIIYSNGDFALSILEKMSNISDQVLKTQVDLAAKQLRGRIAYIILLFADQIYRSSRFDLPISRKEIGDLIEMRTENVIRILSEFRKDGIITIEGTTIEILKTDLLRKISDLG
jgi:CRP/FNR family transcriptional regulator